MTDNPNTPKSTGSKTDKSNKPKLPSNFNVLTFTAACPSCGANVEFSSAGSVMAVCEYCQTTVLRDGDELKAQGKQSLTIEDYSPLQVGSVGRYQKHDFAIIGRIQLSYEDGIWNEWYIQFANGRNGWLSEALGLYSLTLSKGEYPNLPSYNQLAINDTVNFAGTDYQVTDRRTAHAIAGEGELPFVMGKGWQTWVIDARFKRKFITLDYGETGADGVPTVFVGHAVQLDELNMQLLKDDRQIKEQAGQAAQAGGLGGDDTSNTTGADGTTYKPKSLVISKIECPNCASPIPYIEGKTDFLICSYCHSESKLTGSHAELLKMHSAMQHLNTTLPLGAKARIKASDILDINEYASAQDDVDDGSTPSTPPNPAALAGKYHDYVVIGIMCLNEVGEYATWTEYLLYSLTDGFLWLSEESRGWFVSRVLNEMPVSERGSIIYDNRRWQQVGNSYQSRVIFAIGAFNWQVKINDSNILIDYANGSEVITSEQTSKEITYTHAKPLAAAKFKEWFGAYLSEEDADQLEEFDYDGDLKGLLIWHAILQFFALVLTGGSIMLALIFAVILFLLYFIKMPDDVENPFHYQSPRKKIGVVIIAIGLIMSSIAGLASSSNNGTTATSGGGGVIIVPSGRTGYSSSGSHK